MKKEDILASPSMPLAGPSYPHGPYRFVDREYMIIIYESDPDAIRAAVPEPLIPDPSNQVFYEWIKMPDSSGFGDYTDAQLMGGSDSFAAAKAHQSRRQEHRKHNREMRRLEVSEKVARYQAAEDQKLDQFRALIQAGPIKIPKRT